MTLNKLRRKVITICNEDSSRRVNGPETTANHDLVPRTELFIPREKNKKKAFIHWQVSIGII